VPGRLAVEHADQAAGAGHERGAGDPVPGADVRLRPRVDAPGGDPGELEAARAARAQDADAVGQTGERRAAVGALVAAQERRDRRLGQRAAGAHGNRLAVARDAEAGAAGEELAGDGVVDGAGDRRAGLLQADGHAPVRDPREEVEGPVDAVHEPAPPAGGGLDARALLPHDPVRRALGVQERDDRRLRCRVRPAHEVAGRALDLDLERPAGLGQRRGGAGAHGARREIQVAAHSGACPRR
jgi:hypothetical protein